jgi:hypothetical protein
VQDSVATLRTCSRSTGACPTRYAGWAGETVSRSCASVHGSGAGVGFGPGRVVGTGVVADPLVAGPSSSAARPGSLLAADAVSPLGSSELGSAAGSVGLGEPIAAAESRPPSPPPPARIAPNSSSTATTPANATARRRQ